MKGILPIILLSISASILYYLYNSNKEYAKYSEVLIEYRKDRNDFLNKSSKSPLKGTNYKLEYYEPNVNFRVIARVTKNEKRDTIIMATSTGEIEKFLDFAFLDFKLGKSEYSMPVYKYLEGNNIGDLFFCFLDKTNSSSTYAGGRYIDIEFENA